MLLRLFTLFPFLVAATTTTTCPSGDAPLVNNKPGGNMYAAHFSHSPTSIVNGTIGFRSNQDGHGVIINVSLNFSDSSLGPFAYHVHTQPVPKDGNCTSTLGHFDPFKPNQPRLACDPGNPKACEVGNLSGKHVKIPQYPDGSITVQSEHRDEYVSLDPETVAFIGNRSIVIHNSINGGARIACVNLEAIVTHLR